MSDTPILGADGQPHPNAKQPATTPTMTASQFCGGVISAYLDQMAQSNIDPINALLEMGVQVPHAMIQFVKHATNGLTYPPGS